MTSLNSTEVRQFLLAKYSKQLSAMRVQPAEVPDDFDFFLRGVIDSFGIIEMVGSVEEQFGIELDLSNLDAEQMTILGPLSRYVAQNARPRPI